MFVPPEFRNGPARRAEPLHYQFREAAAAFRMIPVAAVSVLVRYGGNDDLLRELRAAGPHRTLMRRLQRYAVGVPRGALPSLLERGFVEEVHPGVFVQTMPSLYSDVFGFDLFRDGFTPEETML